MRLKDQPLEDILVSLILHAVRNCLLVPVRAVAQACLTAAVPFFEPVSRAAFAAAVPSLPRASTASKARSSRFFRFVHPQSVNKLPQYGTASSPVVTRMA